MKNTSLKTVIYGIVIFCSTSLCGMQSDAGNPYVSPSHALMQLCALNSTCCSCGLGGDCANVKQFCRYMVPDAIGTAARGCSQATNCCVLGCVGCAIWTFIGPRNMIGEATNKTIEFASNVQVSAAKTFACRSSRPTESVSE